MKEIHTQAAIAGGGLGACAAALAVAELGYKALIIGEHQIIGGQVTSQLTPCDEHRWIETTGCTKSYRTFRNTIRRLFLADHPHIQDPLVNPGMSWVSRISCNPKYALDALNVMLAPHISRGNITVLQSYTILNAETNGDVVKSASFISTETGDRIDVCADFFLDATDCGDLLPATGAEYVSGSESRYETNEPHAKDDSDENNVQALTWCMAVGYDPSREESKDTEDDPPEQYEFWKHYIPSLTPPWTGKLLSLVHCHPQTLKPRSIIFQSDHPNQHDLWSYRRLICRQHDPMHPEVAVLNFPQNDYMLKNIIDKPQSEVAIALHEAKQLTLSLYYWLKYEAPNPSGKSGWRGLFQVENLTGAHHNGLALAPYIRESRRIKAKFTITENHIGVESRRAQGFGHAEHFQDSVGIGYYNLDLHPTTGGDNYIDIPAHPFQIPLGCLLPIRMRNLLPACKNIGTTHITNGCCRLHPIEWNIGEAVGALAAYCLHKKTTPHHVYETPSLLKDYQLKLEKIGMPLKWDLPAD